MFVPSRWKTWQAWSARAAISSTRPSTWKALTVRWTYRWLQWALQMPSIMKNWRQAQAARKQGDGWANEASPGSHWQLILHFTNLARAKAELAATGLELER